MSAAIASSIDPLWSSLFGIHFHFVSKEYLLVTTRKLLWFLPLQRLYGIMATLEALKTNFNGFLVIQRSKNTCFGNFSRLKVFALNFS